MSGTSPDRKLLESSGRGLPIRRDGADVARDLPALERDLTVPRLVAALVSSVVLVAASASFAASGDPRAEKERLTPADNALARKAAVRRSDLPAGWRTLALPADDGGRCKSFDPDLSAFTITGKARSGWVDPAGRSVVSLVEVYATRADAAGDFAAAARPAAARCLREAVGAGSAPGASLRVRSARMVRAPRAGDGSAAYRLVASLSTGGLPLELYLDVVVVRRGRTIVALMLTSLHRPLARRDQLARAIAARMR